MARFPYGVASVSIGQNSQKRNHSSNMLLDFDGTVFKIKNKLKICSSCFRASR